MVNKDTLMLLVKLLHCCLVNELEFHTTHGLTGQSGLDIYFC